ncbi:hypothetical protein FALBO_604 [Fusarium albosuccineum]|uniref:Uncharacterized protein n=1 Tax=Fusarium albosuccineum TaxID=1237068 RepID=A0A8H4LR89_9HYPO|nr:hypothetical protein FALBO_604 [Fusarium albosuccineum]
MPPSPKLSERPHSDDGFDPNERSCTDSTPAPTLGSAQQPSITMNTDDIRQHYHLIHDAGTISWILKMRQPPPVSIENITGLDCLLVVLRRIYCEYMLGSDGIAQKQWFKDAEARNPLLRHAWLMNGEPVSKVQHEREAISDALERSKKNLVKELQKFQDPNASFLDMCTGTLMNATLWGYEPFHLLDKRIIMPKDDNDEFNQVDWAIDEVAEWSIIELNLQENPDQTLHGAVEECFGCDNEDGILYVPSQPTIVRVLYTPGAERCLGLHDLRHFTLPQGEYFKVGDDQNKYMEDTHRLEYCLIAVVRLRSSPEENDNVRTYETNGANIAAESEPRLITPGDWSIGSSAHTFMLFFSQTDEVPDEDWPEISGPEQILDFEREQLFEDVLAKGTGQPARNIREGMRQFHLPRQPVVPVDPTDHQPRTSIFIPDRLKHLYSRPRLSPPSSFQIRDDSPASSSIPREESTAQASQRPYPRHNRGRSSEYGNKGKQPKPSTSGEASS